MKPATIFILLLLTFSACKKDLQPCDEFAYGTLQFNNNTGFGNKIYVDNSYRGIAAPYQSFKVEQQAQGVHSFKAVAVDAFGNQIGEVSGNLSAFKCSTAQANIN